MTDADTNAWAENLVGFAIGVVAAMVYYETGGHVGFAVVFVALAWAAYLEVCEGV